MEAKFFLFFALFGLIRSDTPANCTYEDTTGHWKLEIGSGGHDNTVDCSQFDVESSIIAELRFPDIAVDSNNNEGFWTMVYNQGYELVIDGRSYFAFFDYDSSNDDLCAKTKNGWSHTTNVTDWACYRATKVETGTRKKQRIEIENWNSKILSQPYRPSQKFVDKINSMQSSWKATLYPELSQFTVGEVLARAGGISRGSSDSSHSISPQHTSDEGSHEDSHSSLPSSWDWRSVGGVNYVSPVRNQGGCGSCFAFASMGMIEARERILTNNTVQNVYSPQDVISCSEYSQGCEGGFEYLTAGKYAKDFGVVVEACNPYLGRDTKSCTTKPTCERHYATDYRYVGGYFGACNESVMLMDLVKNGPLAVAFEVYGDFMNYRTGIYHHVVEERGVHLEGVGFNPFQLVNHGVLIVGYGAEEATGEKYWIVKNSWGESWGEKGFFRIRRGTNECSIEHMAVASIPVAKE